MYYTSGSIILTFAPCDFFFGLASGSVLVLVLVLGASGSVLSTRQNVSMVLSICSSV